MIAEGEAQGLRLAKALPRALEPANLEERMGQLEPEVDRETYPNGAIAVDPAIRQGRLLTGADFDIESFRRRPTAPSGSATSSGRSCCTPTPRAACSRRRSRCPACSRPTTRSWACGTPNLPRSRGFEGMAITPNGKFLYPMLEGALTTDPDQRRLIINQFDLRTRAYTGRQWFYRLEATRRRPGDRRLHRRRTTGRSS